MTKLGVEHIVEATVHRLTCPNWAANKTTEVDNEDNHKKARRRPPKRWRKRGFRHLVDNKFVRKPGFKRLHNAVTGDVPPVKLPGSNRDGLVL